MSVEAEPQWIDDVDDDLFAEDATEPVDGDEVQVREWINRLLRRIARLRRERDTDVRLAAIERERIDLWEASRVGQLDRAIAHHLGPVEAWMSRRLDADPRTRSYDLPAGRIQARRLPDRVEIDPSVIPALLDAFPALARTKVELDKRALNAEVLAGAEFNGVVVERDRVAIHVETEGL